MMKRTIVLIITAIFLLGLLEVAEAQSMFSEDKNYVVTCIPRKAASDVSALSSLDCIQSVEYLDEWGRSLQNIQIGITPSLKNLATYQEYDFMGNPNKSWLPVKFSRTKGYFISLDSLKSNSTNMYNGERYGYSLSIFENSPLNRLEEKYAPGDLWVGDPTGYLFSYEVLSSSSICRYAATSGGNDTIVSIRLTGMYEAGDLLVKEERDEDYHVKIVYTDKLGRRILEEEEGQHRTYYVYDDRSQLRAVLPPQLSDSLTTVGVSWSSSSSNLLRQYAYLYTYDGEGRCSHKRLPGTSWIYYYYDQSGQLILTQDGNLRKQGEYMFTIPDIHGRIALLGICKNNYSFLSNPLHDVNVRAIPDNRDDILKGYNVDGITLSSPMVQIANYYDDYEFMGKNGIPSFNGSILSNELIYGYGICSNKNPIGLQTGQLVRLTDGSYIFQAIYYDERGRIVQRHSTNHLGGGERIWYAYNFSGELTKSKHKHTVAGEMELEECYSYDYDHVGRLIDVYHQLNDTRRIHLLSCSYDELGRVENRKVHDLEASLLSYTYNIRDWLVKIKGDLFAQSLEYISGGSVDWLDYQYGSEQTKYGYMFTYDMLDRLTMAEHWEGRAWQPTNNANKFTEKITAYDKNGNILGLQRYGQIGADTFGLIDNLLLTYDGNQLKAVNDTAKYSAYNNRFEFKDGAKVAVEYAYDANGNLIKDLNKNITDIQYNYLNLPSLIQFGDGSSISYLYDANGVKLRAMHVIDGVTATTDYCGNAIYENGVLGLLLTNVGYITFADKVYHYYLQDHQGNNCVVINQTGEIEEMNRYYPFGGIFSSTNDTQHYKYNGKELDANKGLNWYDYGARHYDAALGRFMVADRFSEKYVSLSPYQYAANNPVNIVDINGDSLSISKSTNTEDVVLAIFNGLQDGTDVAMKWNNGVLDPTSIEQQARNTSDFFLQDLYEIASNKKMVELSIANKNTYKMNDKIINENWDTPYDFNTSEYGAECESLMLLGGSMVGKLIEGNLGQTLVPDRDLASGKKSVGKNVEVLINGRGTLNHRTVGIAHEFGHVILYLRNKPFSHTQEGVDPFVYGRNDKMLKRLGYGK